VEGRSEFPRNKSIEKFLGSLLNTITRSDSTAAFMMSFDGAKVKFSHGFSYAAFYRWIVDEGRRRENDFGYESGYGRRRRNCREGGDCGFGFGARGGGARVSDLEKDFGF
jgi:hypothetical protein